METNLSNGLLLYLREIWTRSPHRMWRIRLLTLSIIFRSHFGIIIPKYRICVSFPRLSIQFPPNNMHLFQCDNEYSFLI